MNRARNGRILLQSHENIVGRGSRIGSILHDLTESQFDGEILRQIHIDIRPEIIPLSPRVGIIAKRRILLEQTALRREADIDIIANGFVTARYRQIVHRLERILLQDGVRPIHIRIKVRIRSILELLKGYVVPRKSHFADRAGLVHQRGELIAVHIVRETETMQLGSLHTQRNLGPSHLSLLRIDQNNAVGASRTVNGRSRGILQDGERFDLRRIHQIQVAFNTIDQNQRIGVSPGSHASDIENGSVIARFAAGLTGDDTRHRAAERIGQRHGGYLGQLLGFDQRQGSGDGCLFLVSVTDHHHILNGSRIHLKCKIDLRPIADVLLYILITQKRDDKDCIGVIDSKKILTFTVGRHTDIGGLQHDGYARNGLFCLRVGNLSRDNEGF